MDPEQELKPGGGVEPITGRFCQDRRRLQVGVILDSVVVPSWLARLVHEIRTSDFLNLAVAVVDLPPRKSLWHQCRRLIGSRVLFHLYAALDHRLFKARMNSLAPADLSNDLFGAEALIWRRNHEGSSSQLNEADLDRLRSANLDVIINLGSQTRNAALAGCARHGVWRLYQGGNAETCGDPALFWQAYKRNPIAATEIRILRTETAGEQALGRSFSRVDFLSLYRCRNGINWRSVALVMRQLRNLHRDGWNSLRLVDPYMAAGDSTRSIAGLPGNLAMVRFLGVGLANLVCRCLQRWFYQKQWVLALQRRPTARPSPEGTTRLRLIVPPKECFYADPFIVKRAGTNYVFCEEFPYRTSKGVISCFEVDGCGNHSQPRVVLERDYHLSYPFVFEWQGKFYLLPETGANRTLELYRAVEFPYRWELAHILMKNVHALDPTLLEHRGKFWLFVNPRVEGHPDCDELELFFADSPLGPWTPHPRNPIIADVRRARPAGRFFWLKGQLFRPAQDCSVRYGYAVSFNRVETLSESDYREVPVSRIDPDWLPGSLATHTYNQNEDYELFDAHILVAKRPLKWLYRLHSRRWLGQTSPTDARIVTPWTPPGGRICATAVGP